MVHSLNVDSSASSPLIPKNISTKVRVAKAVTIVAGLTSMVLAALSASKGYNCIPCQAREAHVANTTPEADPTTCMRSTAWLGASAGLCATVASFALGYLLGK